jgi:hypothetical protein
MPLPEFARFFKKMLCDDSEELGRLSCAILVNERRLIGSRLLGQDCKLASKNTGPSDILGARRQIRGAVDMTVFLVDLVGELMECDIPTFKAGRWTTQDMVPRKDYRPGSPGFTGAHFVTLDRNISRRDSPDRCRIDIGIYQDGFKVRVKVVTTIQQQDARIGRKEPGRTIFNDMLSRIERGEANAILSWKLDRLARNFDDGGKIIGCSSVASFRKSVPLKERICHPTTCS